jgi:hypothetical protein
MPPIDFALKQTQHLIVQLQPLVERRHDQLHVGVQ